MRDDEDRIRSTLSEYSQRCDDGRFEEWAALFTEDARFVMAGNVTEGRDAIRKYMEKVQPPGSRGKHVTTNSLIDVDGDTATAATDYLFVRPTDGGIAIIAAGRYYDRLVRDGTEWRFHEREITMVGDPPRTSNG